MLHKNFVTFKTLEAEGKQYIVAEEEMDFEQMAQDEKKAGKKDKKGKGEEDDEEEKMDDEEEKESSDPIKSIKAFKTMVVRILEDNEMNEKRACKMEIMDFLNLLKIFNEQGVHFK